MLQVLTFITYKEHLNRAIQGHNIKIATEPKLPANHLDYFNYILGMKQLVSKHCVGILKALSTFPVYILTNSNFVLFTRIIINIIYFF